MIVVVFAVILIAIFLWMSSFMPGKVLEIADIQSKREPVVKFSSSTSNHRRALSNVRPSQHELSRT